MKQGFYKKYLRGIFILPILNIMAMVYVQPFVVPYYSLLFPYNYLYLLLVFGSPIWVYLPAALLILPLAFLANKLISKGKLSLFPWLNKAFLLINVLLFGLNLLFVISKLFLNHEPFPKIDYASITDKASNCEAIHNGNFKSRNRYIFRNDSVQTEISLNLKDTFLCHVAWLNTCEYRLINAGKQGAMNDTIDVKITNQTPDYYEGFLRSGKYAIYTRVLKKWE
ncbi:MAG: hypothetical protein Q8R57_10585 [Bacteroidota bacterium]|nr:hypothetical protein [Bacteroidota bacterium]